MSRINAITRYQTVAQELSSLYVESAKMEVAILQDWDDAYQQAVSEGMSYNPASARAKSVVRRWAIEKTKLEGDIQASLVELRYLDRYLDYTSESKE